MKNTSKFGLGLLVGFLFIFPSITQAQTIYKKDPGLFIRGLSSFQKSQTYFSIGPAVGYRFGKHWDVRLHPQLLFVAGLHFNGRLPRDLKKHFSVLNLGLIGGYTTSLSNRWQFRAQLALYKIIQFDGNRYVNNFHVGSPLNSGVASASFYFKIPIGNAVVFYPNVGMLFGYGAKTDSYNYLTDHHFYYLGDPNLTNHFQGFASGGKLGFDMLFKFSPNFYFTISPDIRLIQQTGADELIDAQLNFGFNF